MRLVVLESPFAGDIERNLRYARACVRHCLLRNESPIASHLLYTQDGVLRDEVFGERELGLAAGWAWAEVAHAVVVYTDLGVSNGMQRGIDRAADLGVPIEYRMLGGKWESAA
ncbi:hypothetical protein HGA15_30800 [Nocardia flavorosea]|uniref:DUF7768 domain-containing protein n=2 Tax=Nocardia flavorosea TaxID=53429 RepID=A0A846YRZ5_9NOCA|nr:hypothetical protein [Nocardia flavorosea]